MSVSSVISPRLSWPVLLAAAAALFSGCSTYEEEVSRVVIPFRSGDYFRAAVAAQEGLDDAPDRDKLVWRLEYAASERAAGNWAASNAAFDAAEVEFRKWDNTPDLLVISETQATLLNLTHLPYRGTGYDRIMAATYRAMNELSLGNLDRARVELNKSVARQEEVEANARKQIAASRKEIEEAKQGANGIDATQTAKDPATQMKLNALYGDLASYRIYGDYINPFSIWLHGIFRLATGDGNSDIELGYKSLERLSRIVPGCAPAMADFELATSVRNGAPLPPCVWVVFETGMAPALVQERIDIPVFIVSGTVPYAGIALPKLKFEGGDTPMIAVESGGNVVANTKTVASMDAIIATDFDNRKSWIVMRSIITAGIKVAIQYAANSAARHYANQSGDAVGVLVYLVTYLGTGGISYATTEADLRTWRTLPKAFQIARVPQPADGKLKLLGASPSQTREITLPPGRNHLVMVKASGYGTAFTISVVTLRGEPASVNASGSGTVAPAVVATQ